MAGKITFTPDELLQIALLCRIGLEEISVVDDEVLTELWDKITAVLDKRAMEDIDSLVQRHLGEFEGARDDDGHYDEVDPKIRQTIETVLAQGKRLRIRYYAHTSCETTERIIRPYEIVDDPRGPFLPAFCELRGAERVFRLDGIEEILEVLPPAEKK